ncbi:NAD-dependent epimerase/dehydratase family protein [Microbacterium murale]|uniref:UDP-glucose 4-epimerase n=1 Tax=Microbacterium murale TaxID=1081040 RepID=A0ABU0PBP6_9MICO|nr:NAD(P)-dependent oxidoreductase [Microbacterium murale]MDQ0644755.1 UDP-glucose 4-epimerase [Microbacterium murale]
MKAGDRVIVTGGAGRLGRSVVRALADAGYEVVSIDRATAPDLPAEQREVDLLDPAATRSAFAQLAPVAVVHLAAIAVPGALPDPEVFDVNTRLAWNVLEATVAAGAGALLVASSPTVIGYGSPSGWSPSYLPLDEQHPLAPWNGYAVSKVAIEQIVRMAVRRNGDTMRFGTFRPCYVIAPEEWEGAQTQQGHTVAERLADPTLSAVALFNYIDARDAGDFVRSWLEHASDIPNGEVFFVGAPDSLLDSPTGPALAALVPGTSEQAASLPSDAAVFSSARAERLLGWRARHTWRSELRDAATSITPIDHPQESSRA